MSIIRSLVFNLFLVLAVIAGLFLLAWIYGEQLGTYFLGDERINLTIRDTSVIAKIANSPEETRLGLSGVESLDEQAGMLFIFDKVGYYGFWMKDMLIPLDIIWIDEKGKIVHIEENVQPDSYPTIYESRTPARFVLEVNAFFVNTFSIEVGDQVIIPANQLPTDLQ